MLKALIIATLLLSPLITSPSTPTPSDELTITVTGQEPWYPVYDKVRRSFTILAHVDYAGVAQPGATITFTIYDPRGDVDGSITRSTDANGEMTFTHYFINSAKRGTYTVVVDVEKGGLTGTTQVDIEYLR